MDSTARKNSADHVPGSKRKNRRRPYPCRCNYCLLGKAIEHELVRSRRERKALRHEENADA